MSRSVRNGLIGAGVGAAVAAVLVPAIAGGSARPAPPEESPLLAQLTGEAEFPAPGDLDGIGAAAITIDPDTDEICFDLSVSGIAPATLAHIHVGPPGVAGPIVVDLIPPTSGTSSGCVLDPVDADAIRETPGNYYVNVHNAEFTAGAVRGQLSGPVEGGRAFVLPEPLRAYDSRQDPAGKLTPGSPARTVSLQQGAGAGAPEALAVPPGAVAAVVTLTITETEGAGFVKLYSAALTAEPPTSNINWSESGQNLAVSTTVSVDALGQVNITGGFGATHVVIDVTGYLY